MTRHLASAVLLLAGCSLLAPQPDRSRYYTLAPLAVAEPDGRPLAGVVGVGPVRVASYLDHAEVVVRLGPNQVDFLDLALWAGPLGENVTRVVAANLVRLLGTQQIVEQPSFDGAQPDWVVELDVQQCERAADGAGLFAAGWLIRDGRHRIVERGATSVREPAGAPDTEAAVAALSRAVAGLSGDIAAALRRVGGT